MTAKELLDELEDRLNKKEEKTLTESEWDYLILLFLVLNLTPDKQDSVINIYLGGK